MNIYVWRMRWFSHTFDDFIIRSGFVKAHSEKQAKLTLQARYGSKFSSDLYIDKVDEGEVIVEI